MKLPRSNRPPAYPPPVTDPAPRQGLRELRELQGRPLTHARFNLYSTFGRSYLFLFGAVVAGLSAVLIRDFIRNPDREAIGYSAVLFLAIAAISVVMVLTYRKHRRIHWLVHNCCPRCGYDLRATPGHCPLMRCLSLNPPEGRHGRLARVKVPDRLRVGCASRAREHRNPGVVAAFVGLPFFVRMRALKATKDPILDYERRKKGEAWAWVGLAITLAVCLAAFLLFLHFGPN
jgi:hypothetical protein